MELIALIFKKHKYSVQRTVLECTFSICHLYLFFLIFSTLLLYKIYSWLFSLPTPLINLSLVFEKCELFLEQVCTSCWRGSLWHRVGEGSSVAVGCPVQTLHCCPQLTTIARQCHFSFTHNYSSFPYQPMHLVITVLNSGWLSCPSGCSTHFEDLYSVGFVYKLSLWACWLNVSAHFSLTSSVLVYPSSYIVV